MDPIEALTEAPPKETRKAASTAEAAHWLTNPTHADDQPKSKLQMLFDMIPQLESDGRVCRSCGNLTQRAGTCSVCPTCGTSNGCA